MPTGVYERKPCAPGCACKRHDPAVQSKPCAPGCACGRHNRPRTFDQVAYQAGYRDRPGNREHAAEATRRWREAHPERVREQRTGVKGQQYRLKYMYGLSPEQWAQMVEAQRGCCYLCSEPLALDYQRTVHVDHDHSCCRGARSCGACVRGLSCEDCNKGIGYFGDDPDRMERAAAALRVARADVAARLAIQPQQEELPIDIKRAARQQAADDPALTGTSAVALTPHGEEVSQ